MLLMGMVTMTRRQGRRGGLNIDKGGERGGVEVTVMGIYNNEPG